MAISKKRKELLREDIDIVKILHIKAIERFGAERVKKDLTALWDMRCIWGMQGLLPFGATEFKNLGEMLYIATELCGYEEEKG